MWDWLSDLGTALGDAGSSAYNWAADKLGAAGDYLSGGTSMDGGYGGTPSHGTDVAGLFGNGGYGDLTSGLSNLSSGYESAMTPGGSYEMLSAPTAMSGAQQYFGTNDFGGDKFAGLSGMPTATDSSGAGLVDKATDWMKKNPDLLKSGAQLASTLSAKTGVAPATQQAAGIESGANAFNKGVAEQKNAVGTSEINQAPFYANNAIAASQGAGAARQQALHRQLTAQGYGPDSGVYRDMMAQQGLSNSQADATAYGSAQDARVKAENAGAGLLTNWRPSTSATSSLGSAQATAQQDENAKTSDIYAGLADFAGLYSTPTSAGKTQKSASYS
jgi:hypothetical protein